MDLHVGGGGEAVDVVAFEDVEGGARDEIIVGIEVNIGGTDTAVLQSAVECW